MGRERGGERGRERGRDEGQREGRRERVNITRGVMTRLYVVCTIIIGIPTNYK